MFMTIASWILLTAIVFGASPVWAQEVVLQCGADGKLISAEASGNRTVMPPELSLQQKSSSLNKTILEQRKTYLAKLCDQSDACIGRMKSGEITNRQVRNLLYDVSMVLSAVLTLEMDPQNSEYFVKQREEQSRIWKVAETDPSRFGDLAKENLDKLQRHARGENPALAIQAIEEIEKMLVICRDFINSPNGKEDKRKVGPKDAIKLSYPFEGINRNKAGQYDRASLSKVIEHALLADIDPYAALAIVMLEDAPIANGDRRYQSRYGRIPVDGIGAFDTLGCFSSATKRVMRNVNAEEVRLYKEKQDQFNSADELFRKSLEAWKSKFRKDPEIRQKSEIIELAKSAIDNQLSGGSRSEEQRARLESSQNSLKETLDQKKLVEEKLAEVSQASIERSGEMLQLQFELDRLVETEQRAKDLVKMDHEILSRDIAAEQASKEALQSAKADAELSKILQLYRSSRAASQKFFDFRNSIGYNNKLSELECLANSKFCQGQLQQQSSIPTFDLRSVQSDQLVPESTRMLCTTNKFIRTGAPPDIFETGRQSTLEGSCCLNVQSNLRPEEARVAALSHLGAEFFKKNIQTCFDKNPAELCMQRFNGMGCFGCTEKMPNSCYDGLVGSERPIYGARAMDLMLNTLMPNTEISELITAVAKRTGRTGFSSFCVGKPAGRISIGARSYFEMQKKFLLEGQNGTYLTRFGNDLRKPANATEAETFKKREQERAKQCAPHFK